METIVLWGFESVNVFCVRMVLVGLVGCSRETVQGSSELIAYACSVVYSAELGRLRRRAARIWEMNKAGPGAGCRPALPRVRCQVADGAAGSELHHTLHLTFFPPPPPALP